MKKTHEIFEAAKTELRVKHSFHYVLTDAAKARGRVQKGANAILDTMFDAEDLFEYYKNDDPTEGGSFPDATKRADAASKMVNLSQDLAREIEDATDKWYDELVKLAKKYT
ncbi:MAG: hypothetical protein Unbinned1529contig1001_28 [Prokaryotic dsDNA virus sp.]|nr:MAG: hypothetical protein Unbinned1529contig1001_28 [Prokaryotic dsDNA virus sp.]